MKLFELINKEEYSVDKDTENVEIDSITTTPSKIGPQTLFVLLKSISFDVNKILGYVINRRPAAIICDYDISFNSESIPILRCESTRKALPYIYSAYYGIKYEKMRFCAVTGTNGKTTTATMLSHILVHSGFRVGFIGTGKITVNNKTITDSKYSMTTPDPELLYYAIKEMENAGCEYVVMEVSSHALHFEKVAPIPFEISIFTNLSPEHLDLHRDMDNYFKTKMKLFSSTKVGIFNTDDEYSKRACHEASCEKIKTGILSSADITAKDITLNGLSGSEYIYSENGCLFKIKLCIGGKYNIYNSMMATAAAIRLGVKPSMAKEALAKLELIDGRLEILKDDVTVIIDYAHTEEAFLNLLKTVNAAKNNEQNIITVFGCGGNRDSSKRPKMARVAEKYSDFVIVTTDNSRAESESKIIKDILTGFHSENQRKIITSRKSAIEYAILTAKRGDIITVIGKGHERYNIDKNGYSDFDERAIIKNALRKRKQIYENNT